MTQLPSDTDAARRALLIGSALFVEVPTVISDTVATAPSPADSGLTLTPTDDTLFPDPATDGVFYAIVYPPGVIPSTTTVEILHVTALETGVWTIERGQYRTTVQAIAAGWEIRYSTEAEALDLLAYIRELAIAAADAFPAVFEFTADEADWELPVGATYFSVLVAGAGASGAGGQVGNPENGGVGGGGGAWVMAPCIAAADVSFIDITVGTGGASVAANTDGNDGEASVVSFGSFLQNLTANGGSKGLAVGTGGAGGTITAVFAGYQAAAGGAGGTGTPSAKGDGSTGGRSGSGGGSGGWNDAGGSHFGGDGGGGTGHGAVGLAGNTWRGGNGGGGGNGNTTTGLTGAIGGVAGGGGGGGGAAGTTAGDGGAGGDGRVWILVS